MVLKFGGLMPLGDLNLWFESVRRGLIFGFLANFQKMT